MNGNPATGIKVLRRRWPLLRAVPQRVYPRPRRIHTDDIAHYRIACRAGALDVHATRVARNDLLGPHDDAVHHAHAAHRVGGRIDDRHTRSLVAHGFASLAIDADVV